MSLRSPHSSRHFINVNIYKTAIRRKSVLLMTTDSSVPLGFCRGQNVENRRHVDDVQTDIKIRSMQ